MVVTNFILDHKTVGYTQMVAGADGDPLMPIIQCCRGATSAAELYTGMGGWDGHSEQRKWDARPRSS